MLNNQIIFALVCFTLGMIAKDVVTELWFKWESRNWKDWKENHVNQEPETPGAVIPKEYQAEDDLTYPPGEEPEDVAERKKQEQQRGFFS